VAKLGHHLATCRRAHAPERLAFNLSETPSSIPSGGGGRPRHVGWAGASPRAPVPGAAPPWRGL